MLHSDFIIDLINLMPELDIFRFNEYELKERMVQS